MQLIDTHAHLDEQAFDADRDEVIQRATDAGVTAIISIGITAETSRRAVELAQQFPNVYAVVGIQPNYVADVDETDWQKIEELAVAPKVVGIGETGLDRYWDYAPIQKQADYFTRHIELAKKLTLPFIVHCRDAETDVVAQLRQAAAGGMLSGVMHSFCGDLETARACLELGLHISLAGMVTFKKNDALRAVAKEIPADRLLVETDSPYLSPEPVRKIRRNEPAHVQHTSKLLATVRGVAADELANQTTENAKRLFRLD
ncbi:MAG: TatD family hydrolase [Planctomycetaceae bacterium]|nr:TatD family hydrolase [Planctomycetaceae bacterium]MBT6486677.1 TatD family hydrolase [Planctomycetaceae bacterium]MBT6493338.1 TatD family hydrolase [Planctomycetaceae bacterium]